MYLRIAIYQKSNKGMEKSKKYFAENLNVSNITHEKELSQNHQPVLKQIAIIKPKIDESVKQSERTDGENDEVQTVIEKDCENDYSCIVNSLKTYYR